MFNFRSSELWHLKLSNEGHGLGCSRVLTLREGGCHLSHRQDLVDADEPALRGVGLFEVGKLEVFAADRCLAHLVVPASLTVACLHLPESIVAQTVHEGVLHGVGRVLVDAVVSISVEILFLYLGIDTSCNKRLEFQATYLRYGSSKGTWICRLH